MRLEKKREKKYSIVGFLLFVMIIGSFPGSLVKASEREPVSMHKLLNVPGTSEVYNWFSIKIKATKPFKISLQVYTTTDEYYWIIYSSTDDPLTFEPMERMIERGIGSDFMNEEWQTATRDVQLDLEEAVQQELNYIKKIEITGINFGVRYVKIFSEKEVNGWLITEYHVDTNFGDSLEDPLDEMGWEASEPSCFSLDYDDDLYKYLHALGPLPESENNNGNDNSSGYNYAPDAILYSPTDYGSYYSPYSSMGGYYDNYYGSWGYGGYGLGYGYPGLGYGLSPFGGIYGGYGLGGFGLPYTGYGFPSSLGGIIGDPLGLGLASLTGLGLGISPLLSGFNATSWTDSLDLLSNLGNVPITPLSVPTLVPSTTDVDLSTFLGLGSLGLSGFSDISIPVQTLVPGITTINIPDLSSFLSIDY